MQAARLEKFLRNCSCFAVLTDEQLEQIVSHAQFRQFKLGEIVFRQGDTGDAMYLVYSGKVRILREENEREIPLNTLYPGEHFGELALVKREPRMATVRAAADSTLVAISGQTINRLLENEPELEQYFQQYADRLELWNFIKVVGHIGDDLKAAQLRKLVDQFQEAQFESGRRILAEGDVPDAFYLIRTGRVQVLQGQKVQGVLTAGDTFGGVALLGDPPQPIRWTVRTDGPVEVLKLAAEDFRHLLEEAPSLQRFFEEQLAYYRADEAKDHFHTLSVTLDQQTVERLAREAEAAEPVEIPADLAAESGEMGSPTVSAKLPGVEAEGNVDSAVASEPTRRAFGFSFWRRWRFPFIAQHDMMDCGAACISMITAFHGRPVGVSRLRDLAGVGTDGASLAQLSHAASEIGYQARSVRLSVDGLPRIQLPAILFWRGFHFVVPYALTDRYAYVADPGFGKQRISREELSRSYSGYSLELSPTEAADNVRPQTRAVRRLISLVMENKRTLF